MVKQVPCHPFINDLFLFLCGFSPEVLENIPCLHTSGAQFYLEHQAPHVHVCSVLGGESVLTMSMLTSLDTGERSKISEWTQSTGFDLYKEAEDKYLGLLGA